MTYSVTRRIEIDAGHRIMTHGSKCRHIHGHRYVVEATAVAASLHEDGEQTGMAIDFGFLKTIMIEMIDAPCDHGFIAAVADTELLDMFAPRMAADAWLTSVRQAVASRGYLLTSETRLMTKLYVVPFMPTAECLARHWFDRLETATLEQSGGVAKLAGVTVWETPNCHARYVPADRP